MEEKARRIPILNHLLLLVIAGMVVYLVVDFGRQVVASQDQKKELQALEGDVAAAQAVSDLLADQLAYAESDEAVEAFGRLMGWALPNEVVVVAGPSAAEAAAPAEASPLQGPDAKTNHQAWWDLFFGEH